MNARMHLTALSLTAALALGSTLTACGGDDSDEKSTGGGSSSKTSGTIKAGNQSFGFVIGQTIKADDTAVNNIPGLATAAEVTILHACGDFDGKISQEVCSPSSTEAGVSITAICIDNHPNKFGLGPMIGALAPKENIYRDGSDLNHIWVRGARIPVFLVSIANLQADGDFEKLPDCGTTNTIRHS